MEAQAQVATHMYVQGEEAAFCIMGLLGHPRTISEPYPPLLLADIPLSAFEGMTPPTLQCEVVAVGPCSSPILG